MNHNNTVMLILYKLGGYILLMTDNAKITVEFQLRFAYKKIKKMPILSRRGGKEPMLI